MHSFQDSKTLVKLLTSDTHVVPTFHYEDLDSLDRDHQAYPAALEQFVSG